MPQKLDELNAEIARLKGWKDLDPEGMRQRPWPRIGPDAAWYNEIPNYAGDWQHCGPLLEEMERELHWEGADAIAERAPGVSITEAIARAWLAWKKEVAHGRHKVE